MPSSSASQYFTFYRATLSFWTSRHFPICPNSFRSNFANNRVQPRLERDVRLRRYVNACHYGRLSGRTLCYLLKCSKPIISSAHSEAVFPSVMTVTQLSRGTAAQFHLSRFLCSPSTLLTFPILIRESLKTRFSNSLTSHLKSVLSGLVGLELQTYLVVVCWSTATSKHPFTRVRE